MCVPVADPALLRGLLSRASSLFRMGRPHRAIADLVRIMACDGIADAEVVASARASLDDALPGQKRLFEHYLPDPETAHGRDGPTLATRDTECGVGRHCIYKIKAGTLLFRGGLPHTTATLPGASMRITPPETELAAGTDLDMLVAVANLRQTDLDSAEKGTTSVRSCPTERYIRLNADAPAVRRDPSGLLLRTAPQVDARTADGIHGALSAAKAPHTVVVKHAGLADEFSSWTGADLARELGNTTCHVLSAPKEPNRFTYYWGGPGDERHSHYAEKAKVSSVAMSYAAFRERVHSTVPGDAALYLQTGLTQRTPDGQLSDTAAAGPRLRALLARLRAAVDEMGTVGAGDGRAASGRSNGCDRVQAPPPPPGDGLALVRAMVVEGQMGRYTRTAIFASAAGAVTQLHYDHYDNIYLQLRGRKRFVLLDPIQGGSAAYPYPMHHPLDQRSRIHLDELSHSGKRKSSARAELRRMTVSEVDRTQWPLQGPRG